MSKSRILKVVLVLACIMTIVMPYTSTVLAANLKPTTATAELSIMPTHEGGEESSGTLPAGYSDYYDTRDYRYEIRNDQQYGQTSNSYYTTIYKIIERGDYDFTNMIYCLDEAKRFPGLTSSGYDSLTYTNLGDLKDSTKSTVKALHMSTDYSVDTSTWTKNYNALIWLVNNMYLRKETPEQKDAYLERAFADYTPSAEFANVIGADDKIDVIKTFLTDDDIEVVQQYAIWNFTNKDAEAFDFSDIDIRLTYYDVNDGETSGSYYDLTGYTYRTELTKYLYQYLIRAAAAGTNSGVTFPAIVDQAAACEVTDEYYVVGPFKVTSGTASASEYTLKLYDQNSNEISRSNYNIKLENASDFTNKAVNEIFDTNYYIYIPKSNTTITSVELKLAYSNYETDATLWENSTLDNNDELLYQPVMLLNRSKKDNQQSKKVDIDRVVENTDLALRKYIVSVKSGEKVVNYNFAPQVDVKPLVDGTGTTAIYKHAKTPIEVSNGDTIVYEIRVYNEGNVASKNVRVIDALPNGLELAENSSINSTYGWTKYAEGSNVTVYMTEYLLNKEIAAFNGRTLDSQAVQIELKVKDSALAASTLTNVAEIQTEDITGKEDSTPANNDYTQKDLDSSDYKGANSNKSDLTDSNYYYQGREDDDDFAKVVVKGKAFDLAVKKFISKVNGKTPSTSREPVVDVKPLKEGSDDANYTEVKSPLKVSVGDVITYTLRVYNEGELSGYAEEVSDYLPTGLGYLVGYNTNVDNYWSIPENAKTVKLNIITNGTKNLTKDQFTNVSSLADVDVVVGSAKLTSTKLKSNDTDTKNLIEGFNPKTNSVLSYKDIQITCIVLSDDVSNVSFKNIAEVTRDTDKDRKDVDDRDSRPDSVDPNNYPDSEKRDDGTYQDDNDYENLTVDDKVFDLALQKFITAVNNTKIEDREPKVSVNNSGAITITPGKTDALAVENNDLITYTIRVYNQGDIAGYATEITDSIPKGLVFAKDNAINTKYGWKMYDANGKETTDTASAVTVKTDFLSKAKSDARNNDKALIAAYDSVAKKVSYVDIQVAFRVSEAQAKTVSGRSAINTAEITDDEDEFGNEVDDKDSTPGNNKSGEDDQDTEKVYVKYFDLSLQKDLVKIIVIEDGVTKEVSVNANSLHKVEVHRKKINSTVVKFVYTITVKNEGEIAGYAKEITDYVPDGLTFNKDDNTNWTQDGNVLKTTALASTLLQPGQTASVQVTLRWVNGENNFGLKTNVAEISQDSNPSGTPDIDSTPNNKVPTEDDYDDAQVMLQVSTGSAPTYLGLTFVVLAILTTGVVLIRKYVLA